MAPDDFKKFFAMFLLIFFSPEKCGMALSNSQFQLRIRVADFTRKTRSFVSSAFI